MDIKSPQKNQPNPTLNHTTMTEDKKPQKETSNGKAIGKRPRKKQSGGADKVVTGEVMVATKQAMELLVATRPLMADFGV